MKTKLAIKLLDNAYEEIMNLVPKPSFSTESKVITQSMVDIEEILSGIDDLQNKIEELN
jgi:hypothetical protein|tara:strand:+ start:278 stop:454 length:177 start_codon:yes stop_codon:yes gene_type:complete